MNLYGILTIVNLGEIFALTKMLGLTNAKYWRQTDPIGGGDELDRINNTG